MSTAQIPEWMKKTEEYQPQKDSDGFVQKTMLSLLGILSRMKHTAKEADTECSVPLLFAVHLLFILLVSLCRNMFFAYIILAAVILRICFLKDSALRSVVYPAVSAALMTFVIILPAAFLGSPRTLLTMTMKVMLCVALISLPSATLPWNRITSALHAYHIPDLFIFTLDITLKYIVLLGDTAVNSLTSLKLRSVGKNRQKGKSLAGVLGVTFLKSQEMSEEMYGAMTCRGFEGEYTRIYHHLFCARDMVLLVLAAAGIVLFVYLERGMRL